MSIQTRSASFHPPGRTGIAAAIIARQDRIPVWALPKLFIGIIGMGFFFTYFDIGDINVSFIQTCVQIVPGCLPQLASKFIGLPVLFNLTGYMLGALVFSPLADRYGRRDLMMITMMITGLGSLYTLLVGDYTNFILARTLTGIGVGADLVLVNTYINEVAPNQGRVKYTAFIFIMATTGASFGVCLGLFLTTQAAPWPFGLPFAVASPYFSIGWRIMYGIGAMLAIVGLLLRFELPESPRWLVAKGRFSEAERVVASMEQQALTHMRELPPITSGLPVRIKPGSTGYIEIFSNPLYFKRTILLLVIWLVGYITVYSNVAGLTVLMVTLGYPAAEAGLVSSLGVFGTALCAIIAYLFGERLERKLWLPISAILTLSGGIMIALSGKSFGIAALGSVVLSLGSYLWLPMTYTWTTENYPTRARASGFALVDGIGHVGGGIGLTYVASLVLRLGPLWMFIFIGSFLLVASWLAQFGPATRNKRLDEVSP